MAERSHISEEEILYEHEWVKELGKLVAKAGDREVFIEYIFPAGYLLTTGFQFRVDGRAIHVLLQRESLSDSANGVLELSLPEEESAQYRRVVSEEGEIFASVVYPYCNHNRLPHVPLAEIRVATSVELLELVTRCAPKQ